MQIVQSVAIAPLALLDPVDQPAEETLDGALIHGTVSRAARHFDDRRRFAKLLPKPSESP